MPAPDIAIPSRAPAEVSADDTILPFEVAALDLRGRVVRLGPAVDTILAGHDYPQPVAKLLGEAIVLGVMLGTALKFEGRFILQTKTDGPVPMLVVDFTSARQGARLRAARQGARRHRDRERAPRCRRAARQGASRDDHRSGRRDEPLPGPGRARRRHAGGCGARIFPALRADPDAGAARGRRGVPRGLGRSEPHLARRRHPAAVRSARAGARARARSRSGRCAGGRDAAYRQGGRRLDRGPFADRDGRGHRADRSGALLRAAALPPVPRARRARVPQQRTARRMLVLARERGGDAAVVSAT